MEHDVAFPFVEVVEDGGTVVRVPELWSKVAHVPMVMTTIANVRSGVETDYAHARIRIESGLEDLLHEKYISAAESAAVIGAYSWALEVGRRLQQTQNLLSERLISPEG